MSPTARINEVRQHLIAATQAAEESADEIARLREENEGLRRDWKPVECDGRTFNSPTEAALHLLWLLQRLSFYEPHREGQPCDGGRFRRGIIEARKLLAAVDYEKTMKLRPAPASTSAAGRDEGKGEG